MRIVGLTGGIASGKSTVSAQLQAQGFAVIDCDLLAKEVVRKGHWGYKRVVAAFGRDILRADGEVDRDALGQLVFNDPTARRKLNKATHLPVALAILRRLLRHWLAFRWVVVLDMPLLFESGAHKLTRPRVLVACSPSMQLRRLMQRDGSSREDAQARISSQMPLSAKLPLADIVIDNDNGLPELRDQVAKVGVQLRRGTRLRGWLTSPAAVAGVVAGAAALVRRLC